MKNMKKQEKIKKEKIEKNKIIFFNIFINLI